MARCEILDFRLEGKNDAEVKRRGHLDHRSANGIGSR
jgi:hypothetical protein